MFAFSEGFPHGTVLHPYVFLTDGWSRTLRIVRISWLSRNEKQHHHTRQSISIPPQLFICFSTHSTSSLGRRFHAVLPSLPSPPVQDSMLHQVSSRVSTPAAPWRADPASRATVGGGRWFGSSPNRAGTVPWWWIWARHWCGGKGGSNGGAKLLRLFLLVERLETLAVRRARITSKRLYNAVPGRGVVWVRALSVEDGGVNL